MPRYYLEVMYMVWSWVNLYDTKPSMIPYDDLESLLTLEQVSNGKWRQLYIDQAQFHSISPL